MAKFRDSMAHEKSEIGLVTGLAWTEMGGTILQTEVQVLDGKGKMTATGQTSGDVMQGVGLKLRSLIFGRVRTISGWRRTFTRTSTFMCMCRRERFRRMGLPPASRWLRDLRVR